MHPIQSQMVVRAVMEERLQEAASRRRVRAAAHASWRLRLGGMLISAGRRLQRAEPRPAPVEVGTSYAC